MTIQDRIDEIVNTVENMILLHLDEEEREEALGMVEELGFQWQQANAHARAMTVCAAVMAGEKFDPERTTEEELQRLEGIGSNALIQTVSMPVYAGLVQAFLPEPGPYEPDDEDDEDETGGRYGQID